MDIKAFIGEKEVKLISGGVEPDGQGNGTPKPDGSPYVVLMDGVPKMISEKELSNIQVTETPSARKMADALTVEDVIAYAESDGKKLDEAAKHQIRLHKEDYIDLLNEISKEAENTVRYINGEISAEELMLSQAKTREGSTEEQAGQMVDYWSGQLGIEIAENTVLEQISQQEQVNIPPEGENASNAEETPTVPPTEQQ